MIFLEDNKSVVWNFFTDSNNNFCYKKNDDEVEIIQEKCTNIFDVCFDSANNIHIVIQNEKGELFYIIYSDENWKNYKILMSRYSKMSVSNIKLFNINKTPELFYCLAHNYKYYLIHQKIDVNNPIGPVVLDYCLENTFSITCDNDANIHIIYKSENSELILKTFNTSSKSYSDRILNLEDDVKDICISSDFRNNLILLYVIRTKTHYVLTFENITLGYKRTLGFGSDGTCIPYLYCLGNEIVVVWHERFFAYQVSSFNEGNTFTRTNFLGKELTSFPFKRFDKPLQVYYTTKRAIN